MKKTSIVLSVLLIICLLFSGCSSNVRDYKNQDDKNNNKSNESANENEKIYLDDREIAQYIETIELTTDNWKAYIDIVRIDVENKDAFGEVIGIQTRYVMQIKDMGQFSQEFSGVVIEMKNLKTGEATIWECYESDSVTWFEEAYTMDDFECTRIAGKIHLLNIPDRYIQKDKEDKAFIEIKNPYSDSADIYYADKFGDFSYYLQFAKN